MFERGIEANPRKVDVVLALVEPRCIKDIQRLIGFIAALGLFIFKSVERCVPFFKTLKASGKTFSWNKECSKAWRDIKDYLARLPLLSALVKGEVLYIYLSTSRQVVASEGDHVPVYFVN